jgi:ribonuclease HII
MSFESVEKYLGKDHKYQTICGIDEAGRGPWAGPVVACALTMPLQTRIVGLDDSKKLSAEERERLFEILQEKAQYGVGIISSEYIDQFGLSKAVNQAFIQAIQNLETALNIQPTSTPDTKLPTPPTDAPPTAITRTPDFLLIDGKDKLALPYPYKTIIDGDQKIKLIAAASIIAKVTRDRIMQQEAKKYPEYGFENHMGYGTAQHQQALKKHGITPIHRKSYAPIHALFQSQLFQEEENH